jgi:hypothetical protein
VYCTYYPNPFHLGGYILTLESLDGSHERSKPSWDINFGALHDRIAIELCSLLYFEAEKLSKSRGPLGSINRYRHRFVPLTSKMEPRLREPVTKKQVFSSRVVCKVTSRHREHVGPSPVPSRLVRTEQRKLRQNRKIIRRTAKQ